jgi:tight adherence protein C
MLNPMTIAVLALVCFTVVLTLAYAIRVFMNPERTARDRIQEMTGGQKTSDAGAAADSVFAIAANVGRLAAPTDEVETSLLRRRLQQGGFRRKNNLELFTGSRAILAFVLPVLGFLIFRPDKPLYLMVTVLAGATVGYYLPALLVENAIQKRQQALLRPFPDALDLLVASVEAGLGLDAAFRRVAKELDSAAPFLAAELQMVNLEVNAGVSRLDALRRLDERTGLQEINSLVNVLTQAERFGTSVARSLRVHAELVRTKRMLAAEEQAAKISPKLTVVMILFILPSLFIVLIGPAIVRVVRVLLPAMAV